MMIFNMSTSYFHINLFHYFEDYLMMKLTSRVSKVCSPRGPIRVYDFFDWPTTLIALGGDI